MSFSKGFRSRMNTHGLSSYDRAYNDKLRSFKKWFDSSLTRETVTIDGLETVAVIQDQNQANNKDLSDDKYLIVENETVVDTGSQVDWREKVFLVFSNENKTIPTHKQLRMKPSNYIIKWMNDGRVAQSNAFIQNQTLYTLGISMSGNNAWIVNAKMLMYLPDSEDSRTIGIGQRVFIGGAVYKIMFRDYVSRRGLIHFLLEEDFVNPEVDNVEFEIANYYTDLAEPDEVPTGTAEEVIVSGAEVIRVGSTITIDAKVYRDSVETEDGVLEWVVSDVDNVSEVVDQGDNHITIRVAQNFKFVGSIVNIVAKSASGSIDSHTIRVISPY